MWRLCRRNAGTPPSPTSGEERVAWLFASSDDVFGNILRGDRRQRERKAGNTWVRAVLMWEDNHVYPHVIPWRPPSSEADTAVVILLT